MRILLIAPLHDYPTSLSIRAAFQINQFLNSQRIPHDFLWGFSANRPAINYLTRKYTYNGVFYYGHGMEDRLGDALMIIKGLIDTKNIGSLRNSIMYTMACLSGQELAREAIKKGVRAYYGHKIRYFAFVERIGIKYNFLQDWISLVNYIPYQLLNGVSTAIALHKYETYANMLYSRYIGLDKEVNLELLYKNALYLELYGDRDAAL